jgi:hypothetical protein
VSALRQAAIHLDLDGATDIFRVHGWPYPQEDGPDPLFDSGLPRALDFFDEEQVKATLFVIGRTVDDTLARSRLRDAIARGHEVASHTITHRLLTRLSSDEKREEIVSSRKKIEDALGVSVIGFRAPNFDIDRESLELIAEAGYAWDSSLHASSRSAASVELDHVSPAPSRILPDQLLIELPMPQHAPLPFPFHPSYSLIFGGAYFAFGLRRFRRIEAPLVLLFHLTDLADPVPRHIASSLASRFFTLSFLSGDLKRARCSRMLARVRDAYTLVKTPALFDSL